MDVADGRTMSNLYSSAFGGGGGGGGSNGQPHDSKGTSKVKQRALSSFKDSSHKFYSNIYLNNSVFI